VPKKRRKNNRRVPPAILAMIREHIPATVWANVCSTERPPSFKRSKAPSTRSRTLFSRRSNSVGFWLCWFSRLAVQTRTAGSAPWLARPHRCTLCPTRPRCLEGVCPESRRRHPAHPHWPAPVQNCRACHRGSSTSPACGQSTRDAEPNNRYSVLDIRMLWSPFSGTFLVENRAADDTQSRICLYQHSTGRPPGFRIGSKAKGAKR